MVNDLDLDDDDLVTTHETLRSIKEMFEESSKGKLVPDEAVTLDDAMWYVEEQMSEDLQDEYSADQ